MEDGGFGDLCFIALYLIVFIGIIGFIAYQMVDDLYFDTRSDEYLKGCADFPNDTVYNEVVQYRGNATLIPFYRGSNYNETCENYVLGWEKAQR